MGNLKLHVRNYRAVKSADIELAGLTVLAGVNSSGKSTIARLFHRMVCVQSNYSSYAAEDAYRYFRNIVISPLRRILLSDSIDRRFIRIIETVGHLRGLNNFETFIDRARDRISQLLNEEPIVNLTKDARFFDAVNDFIPKFYEAVPRADARKGVIGWIDEVVDIAKARYKAMTERDTGSSSLFYSTTIDDDSLEDLAKDDYEGTMFEGLCGNAKVELILSEDDVILVNHSDRSLPMGKLFSLVQSFYIAKPSVDSPRIMLNRLRLNDVDYPIPHLKTHVEGMNRNDLGIEAMIGGRIVTPRDKSDIYSSEWRYSDGERSFGLEHCAEGIKSVATLSILDKYGLLESGALLVIDEPEVHLHPQWVVGMARILVKIAKERGVRVLITTHSPDLVHAIRDFVENSNFSANTCFYLSEKEIDTDKTFAYRKLDMNIGPIFSVFNVAKTQIGIVSQAIRDRGTL